MRLDSIATTNDTINSSIALLPGDSLNDTVISLPPNSNPRNIVSKTKKVSSKLNMDMFAVKSEGSMCYSFPEDPTPNDKLIHVAKTSKPLPQVDGEDPPQDFFLDHLSRWCLLLSILFCEFGIGWCWLSQASTYRESMIYYSDLSSLQYRILNEEFLYIYFLFAPFGCWLVDKKFSFSVFWGAATLSLGAIGQYFAGNDFNLKIAANFILSMSQITVFPSPGFIADRYFPKRLRSVVVAMPLFINMAGCGLAQWLPIWIMNDSNDLETISDNYDTITLIGIFTAVPSLLLYIPWLCHPLKPNEPESHGDEI